MTFLKFYIFILSTRLFLRLILNGATEPNKEVKIGEEIKKLLIFLIALFITSYLVYYGFMYSGMEVINFLKTIF